jgi:CDGSH iron-sulfur domain-containing protein 3
MSEPPRIAKAAPYALDVTAGRSYFWCACGLSASQPFCDGSHKGTSFVPLKYTAEKDGRAFFCGCKQSSMAPMCDGTHKGLASS